MREPRRSSERRFSRTLGSMAIYCVPYTVRRILYDIQCSCQVKFYERFILQRVWCGASNWQPPMNGGGRDAGCTDANTPEQCVVVLHARRIMRRWTLPKGEQSYGAIRDNRRPAARRDENTEEILEAL